MNGEYVKQNDRFIINEELADKILDDKKDPDGQLLFEYSKSLAKLIAPKKDSKNGEKSKKDKKENEKKELSSTQLRKYFSFVKRISTENYKYELKRFMAVFLYSIKKKGFSNKEFVDSIKTLVLKVSEKDEEAFKRFKDFFEALIAYHKYYGGKE
ncbi:type III-A CRISPR-associated protein Csm2 [Thermosipho ferrireducens]|uniref:CRISPR system Cms protein Csm2 n=1 Tax=Thermosipho ferrireducens TaxID=2571116 RepID=A0ABX7SAK1_9BACT|nr:type III-A CRISPR-associated protein Csm2 [Thermosipho ferrireducens]QTA38792.1 type III-A CRISPR-associated protein Csm2 [Thermosipho ferrireducens]